MGGEESSGDESNPSKKDKTKGKGKKESGGGGGAQRVKKFVSFRLTQLPPRGSTVGAASGDATLTMLMFEADSCHSIVGMGGEVSKKIYKGGSGGAFEKFWNLKIGTVVAILNPRILRPLKVCFWQLPLVSSSG